MLVNERNQGTLCFKHVKAWMFKLDLPKAADLISEIAYLCNKIIKVVYILDDSGKEDALP